MKKMRKLKQIFKKAGLQRVLPLWMVVILIIQSSLIVGLVEYFMMKRNFDAALLKLAEETKNPEELVLILKQQVIPQKGYTLSVKWEDIGKKLLESGVIDKTKYEELFTNDKGAKVSMKYLMTSSGDHMRIDEQNSHFMVNTLWALGLVNKNPILTEGQMKTEDDGDVMAYASTGGWTLGAKSTSELYASEELITLTESQQKLVEKIAANVYRPCCGNSVAFPDCNHGMAALGYIQLAVKQNVSEKQIYKDLLALNSFWFPQTYVNLAAFMDKNKTEWKDVDAKLALSATYSSAEGASKVSQSIQNIPGLQSQGGGCGA